MPRFFAHQDHSIDSLELNFTVTSAIPVTTIGGMHAVTIDEDRYEQLKKELTHKAKQ